ncbi:MAG: hypothetical protein WC357_04975, partial [Candidatus Omnitrophota bacterium]
MREIKIVIRETLEKRKSLAKVLSAAISHSKPQGDDKANWFKAVGYVDGAINHICHFIIVEQYSMDRVKELLEDVVNSILNDINDSENKELKTILVQGLSEIAVIIKNGLPSQVWEELVQTFQEGKQVVSIVHKEGGIRKYNKMSDEERINKLTEMNPGRPEAEYKIEVFKEKLREELKELKELERRGRGLSWLANIMIANLPLELREKIKGLGGVREADIKEWLKHKKTIQEINREIEDIKAKREDKWSCGVNAPEASMRERAMANEMIKDNHTLWALIEAYKTLGLYYVAFRANSNKFMKLVADKQLERKLGVVIDGHMYLVEGVAADGMILVRSGNDNGCVRRDKVALSELIDEKGEIILFAQRRVKEKYFKEARELSEEELKSMIVEGVSSGANSGSSMGGGASSCGNSGAGAGAGTEDKKDKLESKNKYNFTHHLESIIIEHKGEEASSDEKEAELIIGFNPSNIGILGSKETNGLLEETTGKALVVIVNPDGTLTVKAYDSKAPPVANTESRANSTSSKNVSPIALVLIILSAKETALQSGKETAAAQTKAQVESKEMNVEFVSLREALRKAGIAIIAVEVEDASIKSVIDDEHI